MQSEEGSFIDVRLADAVFSAMALLAMQVENQPRYFDLPPVDKAMSDLAMPILRDLDEFLSAQHRANLRSYVTQFAQPLFANHRCGDGRFIFINAIGHVHQPRACLETLGILDDLIAQGMVVATPYDRTKADSNISDAGSLSSQWKRKLHALMAERLLTKPADEWERLLQTAGVPVSVVRTTDEWLSWPTPQQGGNTAEFVDPQFGKTRQSGRFVSIEGASVASPGLRPRRVSEGKWTAELKASPNDAPVNAGRFLDGIRVLDLSNVIAGPAAARILAEFGAEVTRIDPIFPQAGPRMTMWFGLDVNQGKRAAIVDLKTPKGRDILERLLVRSDIVVHNYLDRSLAGIGISLQPLHAIKPNILTCQDNGW